MMHLTSPLRDDDDYGSPKRGDQQERQIKHALLERPPDGRLEQRIGRQKVHFSDATYLKAIEDTIMAADVAEKAERERNLTVRLMQKARSKEAELYNRMNQLYNNHGSEPKRSCCRQMQESKI